jgi:phosphatidylserine/phosphatidylglycerophosphate/cardiolipin synthase-like enzyme
MIGRFHFFLVALIVASLSGCVSLPPGADFPKVSSSALAHPEKTRLGHQFEKPSRQQGGKSGFRIIPVGADGFLVRMQMINAAERTLDLQYYIFRGDDTGRLPLLADDVQLYEIRSILGNVRGSGQTAAISCYGNYSLHAKLFVFDRQRLFIGSMTSTSDQSTSTLKLA